MSVTFSIAIVLRLISLQWVKLQNSVLAAVIPVIGQFVSARAMGDVGNQVSPTQNCGNCSCKPGQWVTSGNRDTLSRDRQNCTSKSFGAGDGNKRMTDGLWGALPDEVISTVLACLPLISLLRFCCVCKKWKGLLRDQHFQETRARVCGGTQLYRQYIQLMQKSPTFSGSQVVSSVGGLLLLTETDLDDVHVIDPSKASLRLIPRMPNPKGRQYIGCGMVKNQNVPSKSHSGSRYYTVGMVMHPQTRVYNILAVSKGIQGRVAVQLYDSSQDSWRLAGSILPEPDQMRFHIVSVVLHDDALHCLCVGFNAHLVPKFQVLRYEKQRRRWHDLVGVFPKVRYDNRSSPLLFEHRGRLLFAGASNQSFCIWQYDSEQLEWRVINFFPHETLMGSELGLGFFSHACGDFLCVGRYPVQITCLTTFPQVLFRRTSSETSVIIYNQLDKSWRLLSRHESENRLVGWLKRTFLYESSPFIESNQ